MGKLKVIFIKTLVALLNRNLLRAILPDKFILYGHLISDGYHVAENRYRFPSSQEFSFFIQYIRNLGYSFVSFSEYLACDGKKKILLTFDDGFNVIKKETHNYLKENRIPYMVFILTAPLLDSNFQMDIFKPFSNNRTENDYLSSSEINFLKNEGVEIGFHTKNHHLVTNETIHDNFEFEIEKQFEHLFTEPLAFAYPYKAPDHFDEFDEIIKRINGAKYFFDTKGIAENQKNHYFRMSIDSFIGNNAKNIVLYNLKLEAAILLIKRIKGRRYYDQD